MLFDGYVLFRLDFVTRGYLRIKPKTNAMQSEMRALGISAYVASHIRWNLNIKCVCHIFERVIRQAYMKALKEFGGLLMNMDSW